ncbi:plasmid recombination protein [Diplocloster modestus]|uniref:Plasmid recombination protein n=1 Tax=Diplocloster modestus TaxID=2850322 RepID=A0ABS6K8N7_9FIRM|nr:plasmid recombination protein [Diplocloster modestus]MBU9726889.1 plasmid recombination protein [Diplocloster modestus]
MAVEIIFQCGDKKFWEKHTDKKEKMHYVFSYLLNKLQEYLPDFKVANAVIHFDEASPHMHVVGVPVWEGAKRGLAKKVSKRNVFTPETLSVILQDRLREEAGMCFRFNVIEELAEKSLGRNHDLSVVEYKVTKEAEHLEELKEQVKDSDLDLFAKKLAYKEVSRTQDKRLNEIKDDIRSREMEIESLGYQTCSMKSNLNE